MRRRDRHLIRLQRRVLLEQLRAATRKRDLSAMQPLIARLSRLGVDHALIEREVMAAACSPAPAVKQEAKP